MSEPAVKTVKTENSRDRAALNLGFAETIFKCLADLDEKVVFAESCTGGDIVATMSKLPGISKHLCGSLVSYRPLAKQKWLGVDCRTIEKHTTESEEVAREMAMGALRKTPEATWSLGIVGHFGPDAPEGEDGKIYVCIVRRTAKGNLKIKDELEHLVVPADRGSRQRMATEVCLTTLARHLMKRTHRDEKDKDKAQKKEDKKAKKVLV